MEIGSDAWQIANTNGGNRAAGTKTKKCVSKSAPFLILPEFTRPTPPETPSGHEAVIQPAIDVELPRSPPDWIHRLTLSWVYMIG